MAGPGPRRGDHTLQIVVVVLAAVGRDQRRARTDPRGERRAAPADALDQPVLADDQPEREAEVHHLGTLLARRPEFARFGGVDQSVATTGDPAEWRGRGDGVDAGVEERRPVIRLDGIQGGDDIVEGVGQLAPVAVAHPEERLREVVERAPAVRPLADHAVGVEPDQHALVVIILGPLIAGERLGPAVRHDLLVGRVDQRPPRLAGLAIVIGRDRRQLVERLGQRHHARPRRQHVAPELRLALVDPQQAVAHRRAVVGGPQVGRAAELAVPAMGIFVGEQVAVVDVGIPVEEIVGRRLVLRRAVMFEAEAVDAVRQREQEVVVTVVLRTEQLHRLRDQRPMGVELRRARVELIGAIGEQVERDVARQRLDARIAAGEQRRIGERVERNVAEMQRAALRPVVAGGERRRRGPARGDDHRRIDHDLPDEVAGRVEHGRNPFEREDVRRHHHRTLRVARRRQELEGDIQRCDAGRDVDVEGVDVDGIAPPRHRLAAGRDRQPGDLVDLALRRMVAGQPRRVEQDQRTGRHGNGLVDPEHAVGEVGRVDLQRDRARIRHVARRGDGVRRDDRLRCAGACRGGCHLGTSRGCGEE